MMLQSLISLSDSEVELVTRAVRQWCHSHHCDIDSAEGRRALTLAVELVQSKHVEESLLSELTRRLGPLGDTPVKVAR